MFIKRLSFFIVLGVALACSLSASLGAATLPELSQKVKERVAPGDWKAEMEA